MIIIIFIWILLSLILMSQFAPLCDNLPEKNKIIVGLIIIISGPILILSSLLTLVLDQFLPEGWDDFDDFNKY